MKTAILFAGQGSQRPGMGRDFYEKYEGFREVFDMLPQSQRRIAFEGPAEELADTVNTQPIMTAFALGVYRLLEDAGMRPDAAAGLSLGEYSALCASGVFTEKQAIELVTFRAEAMAEAARGVDCKMTAILGLDRDTVADCCRIATAKGRVEIANFNCPGQIVIAGEGPAVDMAGELATSKGARRCLPLKVSGPFHTSFMEPAGEKLKERFARETLGKMDFPVYFNCVGRPLNECETVVDMLVRQVSNSVYFEDTIRNMAAAGIDNALEIGPGKALSGFVRKTDGSIRIMTIDTAEDMENVLTVMRGE